MVLKYLIHIESVYTDCLACSGDFIKVGYYYKVKIYAKRITYTYTSNVNALYTHE